MVKWYFVASVLRTVVLSCCSGVLLTPLSLPTLKTAPQVLLKCCLFVLCSGVHCNSHPESHFEWSVVEAQCLEVTLANIPRCWGVIPTNWHPIALSETGSLSVSFHHQLTTFSLLIKFPGEFLDFLYVTSFAVLLSLSASNSTKMQDHEECIPRPPIPLHRFQLSTAKIFR
jgi:hypothetical protein